MAAGGGKEMDAEAAEFMLQPPGFRFHPTDEELTGCYLCPNPVNKPSASATVESILDPRIAFKIIREWLMPQLSCNSVLHIAADSTAEQVEKQTSGTCITRLLEKFRASDTGNQGMKNPSVEHPGSMIEEIEEMGPRNIYIIPHHDTAVEQEGEVLEQGGRWSSLISIGDRPVNITTLRLLHKNIWTDYKKFLENLKLRLAKSFASWRFTIVLDNVWPTKKKVPATQLLLTSSQSTNKVANAVDSGSFTPLATNKVIDKMHPMDRYVLPHPVVHDLKMEYGYCLVLLLASLIATLTFHAACRILFRFPELKFEQLQPISRYNQLETEVATTTRVFILWNSAVFTVSVAIILVLLQHFPLKPWPQIAVASLFGSYMFLIRAISPNDGLPLLLLSLFCLALAAAVKLYRLS